jgi:putative spermidine/putrescine transport system permease protein/spermidine/putrescine transport system permease protein
MTALARPEDRALADLGNASGLATDARRERWTLAALCAPAMLLIAGVILIPTGWLFWLSFYGEDGGLSTENYARIVNSGAYLRILWATFKVSFIVTAACFVLGYPLSYFLSQLPPRAAAICMYAVLLPFWTSLLVRTYAWLVLLQKNGLINGWLMSLGLVDEPLALVHNLTGTVVGMTHIMLPFLVLPLYASMKAIDRDYIRAASNLGASPIGAFWRVFFPLSLPGVSAGLLLVFVLCLGFFVTPALLGGGKIVMIAMRIERSIALYSNWGAASALGVVLLVITLLVLYVASRLMRIDRMIGGGGR